MTRRSPDPITKWPAPIGNWSSLHAAAEALWARAEAMPNRRVDPAWVLNGALAYAFDVLEGVRARHGLPLDSTLGEVLPCVTAESLSHETPDRLRFVVDLLTYAVADDEVREAFGIFESLSPQQQAAALAATKQA